MVSLLNWIELNIRVNFLLLIAALFGKCGKVFTHVRNGD